MRNLTKTFTIAALMIVSTTPYIRAADGTTSSADKVQMAKKFTFEKTQRYELNYLLFVPKDYSASGGKKWPMILFLHGAGERGTNVWKVATHGPPKNVVENPEFPFILVSPQCPEGKTWSNDALLGLLDEIMNTYAVDKSRVYLTGLSMGGYGTWSLGLAHPEKFAAIVPICGGGTPADAKRLQHLPIWVFHGAKDTAVKPERSEAMVKALKEAGAEHVQYTLYPEAGHDSWTVTYNNPDFYEWLLKQKRRQPSATTAK